MEFEDREKGFDAINEERDRWGVTCGGIPQIREGGGWT